MSTLLLNDKEASTIARISLMERTNESKELNPQQPEGKGRPTEPAKAPGFWA